MSSSLTFQQSILRAIVSKICHDVGWHSAHTSTLNVLSDLLNHYLRRLSMLAIDAANLAGRNEPTMDDMFMAFKYIAIDMNQLKDYVLNVESSPLEFSLPVYSLPNRPSRIFDQYDPNEERSEYYDEWLPSLNCTKYIESDSNEHTKSMISADENPIDLNSEKNDLQQNEGKLSETQNQTILDKNDNEQKTDKMEDEIETETADDEQKTKLVFKFSLGKSLEENQSNANQEKSAQNGTDNSNKIALFQSASANDLVNHLMSSKAYLRLLSNANSGSLLPNLENQETRKKLRFPDTQRLPNNHISRENSPEPGEPENADFSANNPLNAINNNIDLDINLKKLKKMPITKKPIKIGSLGLEEFGESVTPSIKVKEIRSNNKERVKKDVTEKISRLKKPKLDKPLNFKFTISSEDKIVASQDNDNLKTTTPVKKRQYKRKDKPIKENVERKPKKAAGRKSVQKQKASNSTDFVPSPLQNASLGSNLFPPKNSKNISDNSFNENEAAETLVSIFESKDVKKENDDSLSYISGIELDMDDSNSKLTSTSKKSSRPNTNNNNKRNKSANQRFKSAEVINSSGDSSSDDNMDVDKIPVSLLVNQSDINESLDNEIPTSNRKRHNSNSSLSSVYSNSSKSSRSTAMIDTGMDIDDSKLLGKAFNEEHHIKSKKPGEEKSKESSKHKKNKKHSKNKHRHGEEKQHKKHKKNRDKERDKDVAKIKEKDFKPKINIKFGQGPSDSNQDPIKLDTLNQSVNKHKVSMKEFDEAKLVDFKESSLIINKIEKKSATKSKKAETEDIHNELVFIKDTTIKTKESKTKKNPIISVATSLFANDSIVNTPSNNKASKSKDVLVKEGKKVKNKDLDLAKGNEELPLPPPSSSSSLKHKKEKSIRDLKKDKDSPHVISKKDENQACTVVSETINVTSETIDNKLWICPICLKPDDGTPMIGCDTCDQWHHYYCLGIQHDPNPGGPWFCPRCFEKQKKKLEKFQKKQEKLAKAKNEEDFVTITVTTNIDETSKPKRPVGRPRKHPPLNLSTPQDSGLTITPIDPTPSLSTTSSSMKYDHNFIKEQQRQSYLTSMEMIMNQAASAGGDVGSIIEKPTQKKEICPKCQSVENLSVNMIGCDSCDQWFHWPCVGINTAPSPDSSWFCAKCIKKKSSKRLWTELDSGSDSEQQSSKHRRKMHHHQKQLSSSRAKSHLEDQIHDDSIVEIQTDSKQSICGTCKQHTKNDLNEEWIACDICDVWYHFVCENIIKAPEKNEHWFCRHCIKKQRNIENQIHSKSKRKL
nr:transcription initiation factor TFIID subunit 3-like isoform X1 [Dermatophagoides farinae]XP_046915604.1 transcription initiation factor TFIID subunit 3-like isoform X1 [Dermatophagoides farinae]